MIQATIYTKGKLLDGFKISGHAAYAHHGHDIVCAAVSTLATITANSLEVQIGQDMVEATEDGLLSCRLPDDLDEVSMIKAQAILKTLEIGLNEIRQEYPKYIMFQKFQSKGGAQKC